MLRCLRRAICFVPVDVCPGRALAVEEPTTKIKFHVFGQEPLKIVADLWTQDFFAAYLMVTRRVLPVFVWCSLMMAKIPCSIICPVVLFFYEVYETYKPCYL